MGAPRHSSNYCSLSFTIYRKCLGLWHPSLFSSTASPSEPPTACSPTSCESTAPHLLMPHPVVAVSPHFHSLTHELCSVSLSPLGPPSALSYVALLFFFLVSGHVSGLTTLLLLGQVLHHSPISVLPLIWHWESPSNVTLITFLAYKLHLLLPNLFQIKALTNRIKAVEGMSEVLQTLFYR